MTSVHTPSVHSFGAPNGGYTPSINGWSAATAAPRKNSVMAGAQAPILSSFAIDLIAQFDAYRTNMKETLRREVEENMQKAKALKDALKESSDLEAEQALQWEQEAIERDELLARVKALGSRTSLDSSRSSKSSKSASLGGGVGVHGGAGGWKKGGNASTNTSPMLTAQNTKKTTTVTTPPQPEKKSRLERIFSKKIIGSNGFRSSKGTTDRPLKEQAQANSNGSTTIANNSSMDLADLRYLPADEENEENEEMYIEEIETQIQDRSASGIGADSDFPEPLEQETQVKLHPTRAKVFSLPKSLRNLKRRIAALRAKGADLKDEQGEAPKESDADKKKFRLIRLLPWRSSAANKSAA